MTRQPNNNFYKIVVILWISLSVASVFLAAITWLDLARQNEVIRKTVAIREDLDGILRALLDAETAQRGFTITGDEKFLEPLTLGESNLPPRFDRLATAARDNDGLLKGVMDLRAQAELSFNYQRQVVSVRKAQGGDAAAAMVSQGEGRRMMDLLRSRVDALHKQTVKLRIGDKDLETDRDAGAVTQARLLRAGLTSLIAGALGIGAGGIAFWLSRLMLGHQRRERDLIEAKLQAERSSQEKTLFLANMSHEIRTPMNAILGFSELLENELRDPKHRQYLKSIRSSGASLLQLMNDILDMSKIEAGVMELRLEPTDPREICDFLHTIFAEPAAKKGVKLECKVAEDLPHALLMDRIRLRQVLVNLVGNAVKFTDQGNIEVRVIWEKQESSSHVTLLIEVEDTGVGIPQDKLESIFTAFVQAGAHVEKEKTGTGLGLSIVKRMTEMMGGSVVAASVMGKGSAFSLRFPNVAVSARLATTEKLVDAALVDFNELRPASVLVVDDNETNCQLVAGLFTGTEHRLTFALNGKDAVEKVRTQRPEIILMDLRMPGMDGRTALNEIRKIPGHELTPVIAVTASSLLHEETELKNRFSGYVRKPFSKKELFEELAQFLQRRPRNESTPSSPDAPTTVCPPELQAELRRLMTTEWPAILDSLAVNECKAFAAKLKNLNQHWPCAPLETYALELGRYADNYLIVELEKHLFGFSTLVARLAPAT